MYLVVCLGADLSDQIEWLNPVPAGCSGSPAPFLQKVAPLKQARINAGARINALPFHSGYRTLRPAISPTPLFGVPFLRIKELVSLPLAGGFDRRTDALNNWHEERGTFGRAPIPP